MRRPIVCAFLFATLLPASRLAAQDLPEASPEAIRAHAQGLTHYLAAENDEAVQHFYRAHELDPTFVVPLFMAALSHGNAGRAAQRDSLYAVVNRHRERLSSYYRHRLDAQMAAVAGDADRTLHFSRAAAVAFPGTKAAYNHALYASNRNRPAEAVEFLTTLDPAREPMRGWVSYWSVLANAQHALGQYESELATARGAVEAYPETLLPLQLEAQALAALGRTSALQAVLERAERIGHTGNLEFGDVLTSAAQELMAHGHGDAAGRLLERAVRWFEKGKPAGVTEVAHLSGHGYALYTAGRYRDALPLYQALARQQPQSGAWQAWLGYLAALDGDAAAGRATIARIQSGEIPLSGVNPLLWEAILRTALGERSEAVTLYERAGTAPRFLHRDPVLLRTLAPDPKFAALLRPAG